MKGSRGPLADIASSKQNSAATNITVGNNGFSVITVNSNNVTIVIGDGGI